MEEVTADLRTADLFAAKFKLDLNTVLNLRLKFGPSTSHSNDIGFKFGIDFKLNYQA